MCLGAQGKANLDAEDKGKQRRGWVASGLEATPEKLKEFGYEPRSLLEEAHAAVSRVRGWGWAREGGAGFAGAG